METQAGACTQQSTLSKAKLKYAERIQPEFRLLARCNGVLKLTNVFIIRTTDAPLLRGVWNIRSDGGCCIFRFFERRFERARCQHFELRPTIPFSCWT